MRTELPRDERAARRDDLLEALASLRAGAEGRARDQAWTVVYRYVSRALPDDRDDERQDVLVAILESVDRLRATSAVGAAAWVRVICRSRQIDVHRAKRRAASEPFDDARTPAGSSEQPRVAVDLAPAVVAAFLARVEEHVARTEPRPEARARRRAQAIATLYRTALDESLPEVAERLDMGIPLGLLTKWVERGRAVIIETIEAERGRDPDVAELFAPFGELAARRRVDAGVPRPARRSRAS